MRRPDPVAVGAAIGLVAIVGYVSWLSWLMQHSTYDTWGALLVGPVLVVVSLPILARAARSAGQPWLLGLAVTAMVLKLVASYARYWMAFDYYEGSADAAQYHDWGTTLSESYRVLDFDVDFGFQFIGTGFIRVLTGLVYAVTGPSLVGGYLVYSWLGFWGLFMAYLAFRTAFPGGFQKRYAVLVLFLPSLLFWPSGLGKEAWMTLGLGFALLGTARLLSQQRGGLPLLALGLGATALVRPHVTVLVIAAVVIAYLVRPSRRVTSMTPVVKVGGMVVLLVASFVALRFAADFLGVEDLSREGFEGALETAQENTAQGGSEFAGAALSSPLGLPWAVVTVLYRPFPWEVDSLQVFIAAAEGVLLMFLTWRYRTSVLSALRLVRKSPYVTFCLAYLFAYVVVFSGFANFGILVRQRSLALPAFLVLLALPVVSKARGRATGPTSRPKELTHR